MRTILYLLAAILILSGCQTTRKQTVENRNYFENNLKALSTTQREALEAALVYSNEVGTRSDGSPTIHPLAGLNKYNWSSYDYYKLDIERFMQDPVKENFMKCVSVPADRVLLVGKSPEGKYLELDMYHDSDGWQANRSMELNNQYMTWVNKVAAEADSENYNVVFITYFRPYYVFIVKGEPVFYRPSGVVETWEGIRNFVEGVHRNVTEHPGEIMVY